MANLSCKWFRRRKSTKLSDDFKEFLDNPKFTNSERVTLVLHLRNLDFAQEQFESAKYLIDRNSWLGILAETYGATECFVKGLDDTTS